MSKIALAIHGGAGTILRSQMTPELEAEYRIGLEAGLKAGWDVLSNGGSSLDAVEAAVASLEDFPLFNAGRGSVFTHEGKNEMDAAMMYGATLKAAPSVRAECEKSGPPCSPGDGKDGARPARGRRCQPVRQGNRCGIRRRRILLHRTPLAAAAGCHCRRTSDARPRSCQAGRNGWGCRLRHVRLFFLLPLQHPPEA